MKTYSIVFFIIFLSLICGFGNALMIYQNESQLILSSDEIVYGKIVDVKSQWNPQKTHIETTATILVADAFKKNDKSISSGSTVPVTVLGGTVGDVTEWVEDMPVFVQDTDAFVYLSKRIDGKYSVNGLYKGVHTLKNNKMGKSKSIKSLSSDSDVEKFKEKINKTLQGIPTDTQTLEVPKLFVAQGGATLPTISSVTPSSASAGTDTTITITGSGFGTKASRESNADVGFFSSTDGTYLYEMYASGWKYFDVNVNGFILNGNSIDSWSDTQIKVKVPTGINTVPYWSGASSGYLRVYKDDGSITNIFPFTVTFGYKKTWGSAKGKWNSAPTYYVNGGSVSGTPTAVQNAAKTWNDSGSSFRFNYGGTTTNPSNGNDGINNIYYGPLVDFQSNPSVIAFASCRATGEYITDCDIEMNPSLSWTTGTASGSTFNVETIILHELGHWLGLLDLYGDLPQLFPADLQGYPSDISPEKKVMFGVNGDFYGNKNVKTLSSADVAGIRWIYPPGPGPTVTSITPSSGLNAGSVSITNLAGTNFVNGATVRLTRSGYPNISATGVTVVSPTKITCTLPINGKEPGKWNVVVINPNSQYGILNDGFTIFPHSDKIDEIGVFRPSTHLFYLDFNGNGMWNGAGVDRQHNFGISEDKPLSGNWNLDGRTEIGVFRPSTHQFYLDYNGNGAWNGAAIDKTYNFGLTGDTPITGDWNNDNKSEIGVFRPSTHLFYLDYTGNGVWNGAGVDRQYNFGLTSDIPITGDWNSDGITEIGVFRPSTHLFYLDYNGNGVWNLASVDRQYNFGITGDIPVTGDWNSDGITEIGVFRNSTHLFYLDYNGNGAWNGAVVDRSYNFGITGDIPVSGKWNGTIVPPVADFSGTPKNGTAPLTVAFTDLSTNTPTSWTWSFGDGNTSTLKNPSNLYSSPGHYTVSMTATNTAGSNITTKLNYINVTQAAVTPVAGFSGTPTTGPAPLTVVFTDLSTNTPTGWAWYFGDENFTAPWALMTASAGWSPRYVLSSVIMPDSSIVLMGGFDSSFKNDVWRSTNNGTTWTQMNTSAGWSPRGYHSSVVMPDGSIVLMGGGTYSIWTNDTWRSTDKGATWTQMIAHAEWSARNAHSSVVMPDGSIVLMGGYDGNIKNDVWRSVDYGTTWTQANASAGWSPRTGLSSVVLPDGSIVLTGGQDSSGQTNDTWRSTDKGATWTKMSANAGWLARSFAGLEVMPDGSIVLIGGTNAGNGPYYNDVWRSTDEGATWTQVTASAGWSGRAAHTSVLMPDGSIVMMGGSDYNYHPRNDVWRLITAGSSAKNPSHTYTTPGTYQVALEVYNPDGYNSTRKIGYISVNGLPAPIANFRGTPTSGTAPLTVAFTDSSTNSPTSWNWSFGDGTWSNRTSAATANVTHTFTIPGHFPVTLYVSNNWGVNSRTDYIDVSDFSNFVAYGDAWKSYNNTHTVIMWNATGSHSWVSTGNATSVEYLVVAGGGSGGGGGAPGGGGGAGGLQTATGFNVTGTITVVVGDGGTYGNNGENSSFSSIVSRGGGAGTSYVPNVKAALGGSGGGGGYLNVTPGNGIAGQGNSGGFGQGTSGGKLASGGGGGASEKGMNFTASASGKGGNGIQVNIIGLLMWYSGGGGGTATAQGAAAGTGGYGGGGSGATVYTANGTSGTANTGGGGGGSHMGNGGNGGSGVVIIRYPTPVTVTPQSNFTANVSSGVAPVTVTFTDTSTDTPTSWNWSYKNVTGDNTEVWFSQSQNVTYTFGIGNFSIALIASNAAGSNISTKNAWVNSTLGVASFTPVGLVTGYSPKSVSFNGTTTLTSPTSWSWWYQGYGTNTSSGMFGTTQNTTWTFTEGIPGVLSFGNFSIFLTVGNAYGNATANQTTWVNITTPISNPDNITVSGNYYVYTYSNVTKNGIFVIPANTTSLEYLIIAGGGHGGGAYGGGGGGGGLLSCTTYAIPGGSVYFPITVGMYGENSSLNSIVAIRGGAANQWGGSGGGGDDGNPGGSGVAGQGYDGGQNVHGAGGTGGGAGGPGSSGGIPLSNSITGSPINYAGGGGGGWMSGSGASSPTIGGGGGGGNNGGYGSTPGKNGTVIIKYAIPGVSFTPSGTTTAYSPASIQFHDTSTGIPNPTSWSWSYQGYGANTSSAIFSTLQNPNMTFKEGVPGVSSNANFSIKLNITNAYGTYSSTQITYINITSPTTNPNETLKNENCEAYVYTDTGNLRAFVVPWWATSTYNGTIKYLVVAGGGTAGYSSQPEYKIPGYGGGGGAGGLLYCSTLSVATPNETFIIDVGSAGENSTLGSANFSTVTAVRGGNGGYGNPDDAGRGGDGMWGGSGGGGGSGGNWYTPNTPESSGGIALPYGQGYNGSYGLGSPVTGGGGGGAGGYGGTYIIGGVTAPGGPGLVFNLTFENITFAEGGNSQDTSYHAPRTTYGSGGTAYWTPYVGIPQNMPGNQGIVIIQACSQLP